MTKTPEALFAEADAAEEAGEFKAATRLREQAHKIDDEEKSFDPGFGIALLLCLWWIPLVVLTVIWREW